MVGVVCWAKRSLTRSVCRFGALPVVLAGRSRGMEPAGPMGRAAAHSCSVQGVATPCPGHRFSRSLGPLAGSRSSGLRQRCRAGQLQGVKSNGPKRWTYKHRVQGVKVGARIAPNAFATAEDGDCTEAPQVCRPRGFRFGQSPKRAAIIPHSRRALNMAKLPILTS